MERDFLEVGDEAWFIADIQAVSTAGNANRMFVTERELGLGIQPGEGAFFYVAGETLEVVGQRGSGKLTQRKWWVVVVECQQQHVPGVLGTDRKLWVVHSHSAIVNI